MNLNNVDYIVFLLSICFHIVIEEKTMLNKRIIRWINIGKGIIHSCIKIKITLLLMLIIALIYRIADVPKYMNFDLYSNTLGAT